jgi:translation elongation factor EF-1alpha
MEEISIVLIGHKDHGKSTLIGRLILDSGSISQERIEGIKRADEALGKKFELAHLVDSFKQEREQEMTMDTTIAVLKGKERIYHLIDVPGHKELISHMLTGASSAQAALLVVAINEGIKEQTIDHLEIAQLLGIRQLGVIVNKMDEAGYRKESFDRVVEELKEILGKIGYSSSNISFFPICAKEGDNVIQSSENMPWYSGDSVMEFIENRFLSLDSFDNLPLRFLVQDSYVEEGIIVGKVESGVLREGQEILFFPQKETNKIKEIKVSGANPKESKSGENIGIVLSKDAKIIRGMVGSSPKDVPKVGNVLAGEVFWIKKPLSKELVCECGTDSSEGELMQLNNVKEGQKSPYKILLRKKIAFDPSSKTILSKIVLKEDGKIIGVGNIN